MPDESVGADDPKDTLRCIDDGMYPALIGAPVVAIRINRAILAEKAAHKRPTLGIAPNVDGVFHADQPRQPGRKRLCRFDDQQLMPPPYDWNGDTQKVQQRLDPRSGRDEHRIDGDPPGSGRDAGDPPTGQLERQRFRPGE